MTPEVFRLRVKLVDEHFPGVDFCQFRHQVFAVGRTGKIHGGKFSGGDVAIGQALAFLTDVQRCQEVVFFFRKHGLAEQRSGGDDPHNVPPHDPLSQGRILHLLADGYFVAFFDELGDVEVRGVVRDPAHGRPFGLPAGLLGQGDLHVPGAHDGVFVEHLVKIAQTKEKNAIRILLFNTQILLHHGRQCHGWLLLNSGVTGPALRGPAQRLRRSACRHLGMSRRKAPATREIRCFLSFR